MSEYTRDDFAKFILETDTEVLMSQAIMYGQNIVNYSDGNLDCSLFILYSNYIVFTTYYYEDYIETEVSMPSHEILEFLLKGMELKRDVSSGDFTGIGIC